MLADPNVSAVAALPGNAGIAECAELLPGDPADPEGVLAQVRRWRSDLVVVGPEGPLVAGVTDALRARGLGCFGPSAAAARLEGSKAFAKQIMAAAGVPTAHYETLTDPAGARAAIRRREPPWVVKADGLAGGKGVTVTTDRARAEAAAVAAVAASGLVVVEDFLEGPELSVFAVVAPGGAQGGASRVVLLEPARDHKRLGDGDTGPNTGGMGAYCPVPDLPADLLDRVRAQIVEPVLAELANRGTPYTGVLYAGLALTAAGPAVVEFNARFGDPEAQVLLARLDSPLTGLLAGEPPQYSAPASVAVVLAAPGYPDRPRLGGRVTGLAAAGRVPGVTVLHAGTRRDDGGEIVVNGGRVLTVTATGATLEQARASAYEALRHLRLEGGQFRTDIASGLPIAGPVRPR